MARLSSPPHHAHGALHARHYPDLVAHSPASIPNTPAQSSFRAPAARRTALPARRTAATRAAAEPKKDGLDFSSNPRSVRRRALPARIGWGLCGGERGDGWEASAIRGEQEKLGAALTPPACSAPYSQPLSTSLSLLSFPSRASATPPKTRPASPTSSRSSPRPTWPARPRTPRRARGRSCTP